MKCEGTFIDFKSIMKMKHVDFWGGNRAELKEGLVCLKQFLITGLNHDQGNLGVNF